MDNGQTVSDVQGQCATELKNGNRWVWAKAQLENYAVVILSLGALAIVYGTYAFVDAWEIRPLQRELSLQVEEKNLVKTRSEKLAEENDQLEEANAHLARQLSAWEFSKAMFEQVPGDFDFFVRDIKIGRTNNASVNLNGPNGERYLICISKLIEDNSTNPPTYSVRFKMKVADRNGNEHWTSESNPELLERDRRIGPFKPLLSNHEFYIYVQEEKVGHVNLAVVRRKPIQTAALGSARASFRHNLFVGGPLMPRESEKLQPMLLSGPK